jgi:AcrR family transcriptional regulator
METFPADDARRRRRPVQRRSVERYERIITSCAELLDENGYSALTTTAVARRAEVPIGTLYQFFADKDALIQALATRNLERYLDRLADRLVERPPAGIADLVDASIEEFTAMRRTVPGFGVVDFGAGGLWDGTGSGDDHVLDATVDNTTVVARRLSILTSKFKGDDDEESAARRDVALRVAVECADAVLKLAFRNDPDGDPVFISECKRVLNGYLAEYYPD